MANQYVNKVIVNNEIKMDLTEDTITPNTLRKGFTAHDASGAPIVGNESLTDISEDGTNAGPILELSAEGWTEQQTISGKNKCPNTVSGTQTINGVTFTVNPDKSITCTGTATADATFDLATPNTILGEIPADIWYCCHGVPKGYDDNCRLYIRTTTNVNNLTGGSSTIVQNGLTSVMKTTAIEYINRVYIKIANGTTVDIVISPQLELGSMTTTYEPYCGGIPSPNPSYPQEIKVARGRNLFDKNNVVSGVVLSSDGSISTDAQNWRTSDYIYVHGMSSIVGSGNNGSSAAQHGGIWYAKDKTFLSWFGANAIRNGKSVSVPSNAYYVRVSSVIADLDTYQLEEGSVPTPYVPYGHVGMEVQGKNLLRPNLTRTLTNKGITVTANGDGTYSVSGTNTDGVYIELEYGLNIKLPAGTYTLSENEYTYNANCQIWMYASVNGQESRIANISSGHSVSFNLPNGGTLTKLAIWFSTTTTTLNYTARPMLEAGSEATDYEPYYHSTIPIPLPSKGFAAALPDETSDILTLDGAGGYKWTNVTNEKIFEGSTNDGYGISTANGVVVATNSNTTYIFPNDKIAPIIASHGVSNTANYQWNNSSDAGVTAINNLGKVLFLLPTSVTTIDGAKTWLASNPVTVLYPIKTPTIEQGYVNEWNNDFPLGCTIDIPELHNINVEYFLYDSITQLADDYYDRTTNDISEAMSQTADSATLEALAAIAPIENDISSANYSTGSYLIHNNQLYKVTTAIATGEAISTNTNITSATIANELLDIDSDLLDFSELLEAAKAEYREKFQAIDSWQAAASQLIREDNGYYSNESITRMLAQRFDGKLYGYSEPKTTAVAITKTGANAGLANPTLGTATIAGSSAYRHLGPFQWFAAKGIVDSDGVPHVSTIKGIDSDADWNADTNNVWSLRPIQWYSIDSTGGTVIGSLSDTWHLGLKPNPQAYLPDGTLRPYMLAPRYALGFENGVGVSKSGFKGYGRDVSHNSLITKLDYANTGYSGKTIYENWYDIFMSRMIYGTKDFQTIMQGCTAYNYQYHPSVAEQDTTRVILSNANAANLVVGSTMMMGNQATVSTDRNNVNAYNIFDGLIIESITEYDADNKSIELATDTTFNTDPAYLFSTAPWHSGSCDTMDWDGSPTNPLSAKECAFFQGCELMTGTYEILANAIIKGEADARQIPYIVYSSRDDATSVTANFVKCGDGLLSNDGTANAWKHPLYIADHNGLLYGEEVGGSITAGCADGQYVRPDSDATNSEWLSVGRLGVGRGAGLSCVVAHNGLGNSYWSIWSRLSPVGLSRG